MSKMRSFKLVSHRKSFGNWWVLAEEGMTRQFLAGPFLTKRLAEREIEATFAAFEELTGRKRRIR